jgi:hypothetical protein
VRREAFMRVSIENNVEFRDTGGKLCGSYHYDDPFKSFFRNLYTPKGRDVVAPLTTDHRHHKGLQYGLCAADVNFWEEDKESDGGGRRIGRQAESPPHPKPSTSTSPRKRGEVRRHR